jgi:hypothetical protein
LPPCDEQEPRTPPEWLNSPSVHCTTYPLVWFQKDGMHENTEQKFDGGEATGFPRLQKL